MTKRFLTGAFVGALILRLCVGTARAETKTATSDNNPTAYDALRLVSKTLGRDALERVVEVSGHDGVPQPYLWKVVLKEGTGSREIDVTGGKIGSQRELARPPASATPIRFADLNLDSSGAFDATDTQARKVKLRYDSLDYDLSVNASSGKPVWHIDLIDKEGSQIGAIRLAAHDGTVLSTNGRLANNNPPPAPPAPVVHHAAPEPTPRVVEPTAPAVQERHAAVGATMVHRTLPPLRQTTSTTTVITSSSQQQDIPVATLSDREDDRAVAAPPPPPEEEGGLFTRVGRTLDRSTHAVKRRVFKDGATVQRFFTGHSDIDQEDRREQ